MLPATRSPKRASTTRSKGSRRPSSRLRELQGNSGGYLLVDRDNSTALTVTFWENRAALESSDMQASRLRSQAVTPHGGEIQAVDRCEVALDFSELSRA